MFSHQVCKIARTNFLKTYKFLNTIDNTYKCTFHLFIYGQVPLKYKGGIVKIFSKTKAVRDGPLCGITKKSGTSSGNY